MEPIHSLTNLAIQWQIGNQCNFQCDYCHPAYWEGSNRFFTTEQLQTALDNLKPAVDSYNSIDIEFQGGEPTYSEAVRNVIANCNDSRYTFSLTTNGTADPTWWTSVGHKLNRVTLAYHGQDNFDQLVSTIKSKELTIVVNAPVEQHRWDKAVEVYERYKDTIPTTFKALYANHYKGNDRFFEYSEEQWQYYTAVNNIDIPQEETVEVQIEWVEEQLYTNYKGHLCWAGIEQIVIDYFGYVYRGWCYAHGSIGNILEGSVVLDPKPKVCPRFVCKNTFDQKARKSENSWGL